MKIQRAQATLPDLKFDGDYFFYFILNSKRDIQDLFIFRSERIARHPPHFHNLFLMKQEKPKKKAKASSKPEKITGVEALKKMKEFSERKEKIIANIRKSKN